MNTASAQGLLRIPLRAGLTGGIGSGKSTVAEIFRSLGCPTLDLDVVSRQVSAAGHPALQEVAALFGPQILHEDGSLNRSRLASIVFSNPDARARLEHVLHPAIMDAAAEWVNSLGASPDPPPVAMLEIPLLFEAGLQSTVDRIVLVTAPLAIRISRLMEGRGLSEEDARRRIAAQQLDSVKIPQSHYVIANDGSIADLHQQVRAIWGHLLQDSARLRSGGIISSDE